ncbi:MAG: hypothetical protein KIT48_21990 [Pseudolabrys sp.]|nr:hypothetical protein [Pseudolabrys sp.]
MADDSIDFDAPDLAARIEQLSQHQLDQLPYGVVLLDRRCVVQFYSATEARESGYGMTPMGRDFFDASRCEGKRDFRERLTRAMDEGPVDFELALPGDLANPLREVRIRALSARGGGVWLFMERDKR